jgi:mannose-6-phosphate isomerase-like protein (cupin superfamily)
MSTRTIEAEEAQERLPESQQERSIALFQHGTLNDPQIPHSRNEIYVVIRGAGDFVCAGERRKFGPHDFLFVPAGVEHRFENFSNDRGVGLLLGTRRRRDRHTAGRPLKIVYLVNEQH